MFSAKDFLSRMGQVVPFVIKELFKRKMEIAGHVL